MAQWSQSGRRLRRLDNAGGDILTNFVTLGNLAEIGAARQKLNRFYVDPSDVSMAIPAAAGSGGLKLLELGMALAVTVYDKTPTDLVKHWPYFVILQEVMLWPFVMESILAGGNFVIGSTFSYISTPLVVAVVSSNFISRSSFLSTAAVMSTLPIVGSVGEISGALPATYSNVLGVSSVMIGNVASTVMSGSFMGYVGGTAILGILGMTPIVSYRLLSVARGLGFGGGQASRLGLVAVWGPVLKDIVTDGIASVGVPLMASAVFHGTANAVVASVGSVGGPTLTVVASVAARAGLLYSIRDKLSFPQPVHDYALAPAARLLKIARDNIVSASLGLGSVIPSAWHSTIHATPSLPASRSSRVHRISVSRGGYAPPGWSSSSSSGSSSSGSSYSGSSSDSDSDSFHSSSEYYTPQGTPVKGTAPSSGGAITPLPPMASGPIEVDPNWSFAGGRLAAHPPSIVVGGVHVMKYGAPAPSSVPPPTGFAAGLIDFAPLPPAVSLSAIPTRPPAGVAVKRPSSIRVRQPTGIKKKSGKKVHFSPPYLPPAIPCNPDRYNIYIDPKWLAGRLAAVSQDVRPHRVTRTIDIDGKFAAVFFNSDATQTVHQFGSSNPVCYLSGEESAYLLEGGCMYEDADGQLSRCIVLTAWDVYAVFPVIASFRPVAILSPCGPVATVPFEMSMLTSCDHDTKFVTALIMGTLHLASGREAERQMDGVLEEVDDNLRQDPPSELEYSDGEDDGATGLTCTVKRGYIKETRSSRVMSYVRGVQKKKICLRWPC